MLSDTINNYEQVKVKVIPQQAEVAQGVPGRLRPRIFLTFPTTRVVGRQPYAPAAFTPGEISGAHFQRLSRPQGTWFYRWEPRKKSPVTPPGIDPGTVRLVAQCLNHYATPGPNNYEHTITIIIIIINVWNQTAIDVVPLITGATGIKPRPVSTSHNRSTHVTYTHTHTHTQLQTSVIFDICARVPRFLTASTCITTAQYLVLH